METPTYGFKLGKYDPATNKYHVGSGTTYWNDRQYWTDGPWAIYVDGVREGSVINFSDYLLNTDNGYPLVGSDKWDQWIAVFGGEPGYVKGQLNSPNKDLSWEINAPYGKKYFANLSDIAVLSGGKGGTFDTKKMFSNFYKSTAPTSSLTADRTAIRAGESVTFTIKGTTNTYYNQYMYVSFAGAGTTYINNQRFDGKNITTTQKVTLDNPGTYTFSLILKDAVMRKASTKTIIISVSPVDQVPTEPVQPPPDTPPPPDNPPPDPGQPEPNQPPVAKFSWPGSAYAGEDVDVDEYSIDYDGSITNWDWNLSTNDASQSLRQGGGVVNFNTPGNYDLKLTVTDNDGATDSLTRSITVYKPIPTAVITTSGTLKENRKVILNSASSRVPATWPIDHSKDEWVTEPVTSGTAIDIKLGTRSGATQEVLFKKAGVYRVSLRVTNVKGTSDWAMKDITIGPDLAPLADFTLNNITYRNPSDSNMATITLKDNSSSPDGDLIVQRTWKYQFDSDNDGLFSDETPVILDSANNKTPALKTNKVGKYLFELTVKEDFGQETILSFILPGDYRTADTVLKAAANKTIDVKNIAPTTSFTTVIKPKVDIVFSQGFLNQYNTRFNNMVANLETIVGAKLKAKGIDYLFYNSTPYTGLKTYSALNDEYAGWHIGSYGSPGTYAAWWVRDRIVDFGEVIDKSIINTARIDWSVWPGTYKLEVSLDGVNWYYVNTYYRLDTGPDSWNVDKNLIPIPQFRYAKLYPRSRNESDMAIIRYSFTINEINFNGLYSAFDKNLNNYSIDSVPPKSIIYDIGRTVTRENTKQFNFTYVFIDSPTSIDVSLDKINWTTVYSWPITGSGWWQYELSKSVPFANLPASYRYVRFKTGSSVQAIDFKIRAHITDSPRATLSDIQKQANKSSRMGASVYIVSLGEEPYQDADATTLQSTADLLNSKNINLAVFADSTSISSVQQLTSKVTNQKVITTTADMTVPLDQLADYIIATTPLNYTSGTKIILLGQSLGYIPNYSDYESDPKIADAWNFVHVPTYLDNNTGFSSYHNQTLLSPVPLFDKVGKYDVKYKAQDDPAAGDARFAPYRLWSDPVPTAVIVHRKPIADFYVTPGTINAVDTSYDPDFQYKRLDKGIVEWKWMWKKATSTTWTIGEPSGIPAPGDYTIHLEVKDVYGAWSDPFEKTVTVVDMNKPPVAAFDWTPKPIYEGDNVTLLNQSTDPDGDPINKSEWTIYDPNGVTTTKTYTSKSNQGLTNVLPGTYWVTLRVWDSKGLTHAVTKSFSVGILGITGYVEHATQWDLNRIRYNQSKTGTDDDPRPYNYYFAGEAFVLKADTTDTGISATKATSVQVSLISKRESENLSANALKTCWSGEMFRDNFEQLPDGNYTFRFIATYSNGIIKTHEVTITIRDSWQEYYNFHRAL